MIRDLGLHAIAAVIGVVLALFFVVLAHVLVEPDLTMAGFLVALLVVWPLTAARGGRSSSARRAH